MNAKKLLDLVKIMNELNENISDETKFAVYLHEKTTEGVVKKSTRYFIMKRPTMNIDGIERWSFVAREEK